jgi:signal transduction histidine kinase
MFRKLRNRFLLMNMGIISLIMLIAFGTIFSITYRNVQNGIQADLHQAEESYHKSGSLRGDKGGGAEDHAHEGRESPGDQRLRSVSFALQADGQWNMTSIASRFDIDSDVYTTVLKNAASRSKQFGQVTIDGVRWAYRVESVPSGYSVVSMDVTAQQKILTNLITTFAAVAAAMLGVIFLTSRFLADRSIKPVKEAFDRQRQFIADASHELKTPLAVINTNADVLLANGEDPINEQAKWLHHIKSEAERMKTLTNDLLYLAEMDDTRSRVIHVPFDLSNAIEGVILTMEPVIYERNLTLDYHIEPGLTLHGSSEQIKQVAMILLDNAIKYTEPGGTVELALKKQQGHSLLTVSNSGPGIPAKDIGRIFDRFYRVDPARSRQNGGYGLGLAIAKSIVEQHRGKIYAKSVPGELTTFYVQF